MWAGSLDPGVPVVRKYSGAPRCLGCDAGSEAAAGTGVCPGEQEGALEIIGFNPLSHQWGNLGSEVMCSR